MKSTWLTILLTIAAASAWAEGTEYVTSVIGQGTMTLDQPRAIFAGKDGRVYLIEGDTDWATGRALSADLSASTRFKPTGTLADNTPVKWFHPASVHPTASGELLVADTGRKRILRLSAEGEFKDMIVAPGPPANLEGPTDAVQLPSGEIAVCDSASSRLVLFGADGKFVRVVASAGTGAEQVNHPFSLALDADGNLWTVDTLNRRLVERGPDLRVMRVVQPMQEDGPALQWPSFVAFDGTGNALVADDGRSCVFRISPAGTVIDRLGMREGERQPFARVTGVAALADGTILATDASRNVIVRFGADGAILGEIGYSHRRGWGGPLVAGGVDASGGFYLVEAQHSCRVRYFGPDGVLRAEFAGTGTEPGKLTRPRAAAVGPDGCLYVADSEQHRVTVYRADGSLVRTFGQWGRGEADLRYPRAIAVGPDGRVYVGDAGNQRVQVYSAKGEFLRTFASKVNPQALDVDAKGRIAVLDDADEALVVFGRDGREISRVAEKSPLAFDGMAFAPDGRVLLLEGRASAIRAYAAEPGKASEPGTYLSDPQLTWWSQLIRGTGGRIFIASPAGVLPLEAGKLGALVAARMPVESGKLLQPDSLALVWGDALAVLSRPAGAVQVFGRDGKFRRVLSLPGLRDAGAVASDASGDLLVLSPGEGTVVRVDKSGGARCVLQSERLKGAVAFSMLPDGGAWAMGMEFRGGGRVYRVDREGKDAGSVFMGGGRRHWGRNFSVTPSGDVVLAERDDGLMAAYAPDGKKLWSFDAGALAEAGRLKGVAATRVNAAGELFTLGGDWSGIRVYGPDRVFERAVKPDMSIGGLSTPSDFAVDTDGTIYIADTGNNRVVKLVVKKPAVR